MCQEYKLVKLAHLSWYVICYLAAMVNLMLGSLVQCR